MHRLAVLVLLLIALAAPAAAQQPAPKTPPAKTRPPPRPQTPMPQGPTAEQCRATCAQAYYFCLAGSEQQDCSPRWAQCRRACGDNGLSR